MRQFHEQLQDLLQRIVLMGTITESMIHSAVNGLVRRSNTHAFEEVFLREDEVNRLQVDVDDRAVKLTALQQPMAQDVRFLFMASRIGGELERIADQAINICQNSRHVLEGPPLQMLAELPIMADLAQKMVRDSLSAMIERNVELAAIVLEEEKKVDAFRNEIFSSLLKSMKKDPEAIERSLSLILIARNLERIGDHATNIAEEVIYWIQGRDVRHSKHKAKAI